MGKNVVCQVELDENPKRYFKLFFLQYKGHERFKLRKQIFLLGGGLIFLFLMAAGYRDFGLLIFSDLNLIINFSINSIIICVLILCCTILCDIKVLYRQYWVMRRILYENGTYTKRILFGAEGFWIEGYEKGERISKYVAYNQVNKMLMSTQGIVMQPYEYKNYIYVTRKQFRSKKEFQIVKGWYRECTKYGKL